MKYKGIILMALFLAIVFTFYTDDHLRHFSAFCCGAYIYDSIKNIFTK